VRFARPFTALGGLLSVAGQRRRRRRESKEGDAKSRCVHGLLHVAMAPRALVALKQEAGKEELEEGGGGGGSIYNQQVTEGR